MLDADDVTLGYGDRTVLAGVRFNVRSGDRIGILGVNGAGKSTLIKSVAGDLAPQAGELRRGAGLAIGYFAQHQLDQLRADETPLQHLRRLAPEAREQQLREFLGQYRFSGEFATSLIGPMSGGEKARCALALIAWKRPNLLLLDEPTNHLDIETREALTVALSSYEGALILVSHDRHLLRATTDQLWLVHDGEVAPFDGDLDDYSSLILASRREGSRKEDTDGYDRRSERKQEAVARQRVASARKPLQNKLNAIETELAQISNELRELDVRLADPDFYHSGAADEVAATLKRRGELARKVDSLESRWLEIQTQLGSDRRYDQQGRRMSRPLDGLTIIDMTRLLPGPAATMHLVDFGADVIKVEDTGAGDYMRNFPPTVALNGGKTVNAAFEAVNRGKRSIAIDLKSEEGREVLLRLVDRADALIEGFRPGVLARLSLGWETLHARNPRLVLCSLSGYGQSGPLSQRAGHDLNYIAMTGVLDQIRAGGKLAIPNLQIGDLLGGTLSALATMLIAMLGALRSGQGVHVDVAMTDGLLAHHLFPHASVDSGVDPVAESTLLTGGVACYQIYQTSDQHHLAVGALELKFWQAFCEAAGLSELKSRHWELGEAPGSPRRLPRSELVAQRIAEYPLKHWLKVFEPVDACVTPVLTPAEALSHPHHLARHLVHRERGVSEIGPLAQMGPPDWASRAAPDHGEHTSALLAEIGYSAADAQRMAAAGVVK